MSKEAYFISKVAYFTSKVQQKYPNLNKKDSSPCVISRHMSLIDHMSHICPIQDSNPCVWSFRVICPLYVICPIYVFFCEPALWGW